jgi:hypothetical protein
MPLTGDSQVNEKAFRIAINSRKLARFYPHDREKSVHLWCYRECRAYRFHRGDREREPAQRHPRRWRQPWSDGDRSAVGSRQQDGAGAVRRSRSLAGTLHVAAGWACERTGRDRCDGVLPCFAKIQLHQRRRDHGRCGDFLAGWIALILLGGRHWASGRRNLC